MCYTIVKHRKACGNVINRILETVNHMANRIVDAARFIIIRFMVISVSQDSQSNAKSLLLGYAAIVQSLVTNTNYHKYFI